MKGLKYIARSLLLQIHVEFMDFTELLTGFTEHLSKYCNKVLEFENQMCHLAIPKSKWAITRQNLDNDLQIPKLPALNNALPSVNFE